MAGNSSAGCSSERDAFALTLGQFNNFRMEYSSLLLHLLSVCVSSVPIAESAVRGSLLQSCRVLSDSIGQGRCTAFLCL